MSASDEFFDHSGFDYDNCNVVVDEAPVVNGACYERAALFCAEYLQTYANRLTGRVGRYDQMIELEYMRLRLCLGKLAFKC